MFVRRRGVWFGSGAEKMFMFIFITRCLTTFQETRLRQPSHNGKKYGRVTSIEEDVAVILLRNSGNLEI